MPGEGPRFGRCSSRLALALVVVVAGASASAVAIAAAGGTAGGDSTIATGPGEAPSGPVPGGSPDAAPHENATVILDGSTYFLGQTLYSEVFGPGDDVDLEYTNGTFVTDVPVTADGAVVIRTTRHGTGNYVLTDNDDTALRFRVARQEYAVVATPQRVRTGGARTTTELAVTSNRNGYTHLVRSPDLSAARLQSILGTGTVRDADADGRREVVIRGGATDQSFRADFAGVRPGNYTLLFEVPDTGARANATVEVTFYPPGDVSLSVGEGPLRLQQVDNQRVTGETTLPAGTSLTVTMRNDGGQPFQRTEVVTVREDGSFEAAFDLSGIPQGQSFTVTVAQNGVVRDSAAGVVVSPAAVSVSTHRSTDGREVVVDGAYLPNGGFVAIATIEGDILGVSAYLRPGRHNDVTIALAEPLPEGSTTLKARLHRDTDGDREFGFDTDATVDRPYVRSGAPVEKLLPVVVSPTPTTPPPTPTTPPPTPTTPPTTPTPTPPRTTSTPTTADDATDGGGGPGVGVTAAVGAILAVALVLRRRTP